MLATAAAFLSALLLMSFATPSGAGGKIRRPPQVDLDPDRGMTFGRYPRTSLDWRILGPLKQGLRSRAMDPKVDPYRPTFKPSRYDPATGTIRGSLTDAARTIGRRRSSDSDSGSRGTGSRTRP